MSLSEEIKNRAAEIFRTDWKTTKGQAVPAPEAITLANAAVYFERATVLYADLDGSTNLVDRYNWWFAAEIYKAYLYAASRVIRAEGGVITSYDGDRVMAVFVGDSQTSNATLAALKINYAVKNIVQPQMNAKYDTAYTIGHKVGIDTSPIHAVRTGIRGDNDVTWVGRAANHAAKLNAIPVEPELWLTKDAYSRTKSDYKSWQGRLIWTKRKWTQMGDQEVYASNWTWTI